MDEIEALWKGVHDASAPARSLRNFTILLCNFDDNFGSLTGFVDVSDGSERPCSQNSFECLAGI